MNKDVLANLYFEKKLSMTEIAKKLGISAHKVVYWMDKYQLKRRSWSEATYVKYNPYGDPFSLEKNPGVEKQFLKGLGLGQYWGEGTKADKFSVRISNSDPYFIKTFINFLKEIYKIDNSKLKFAIHIFSDIDPKEALKYWSKQLNVSQNKFHKTQVIKLNRKGTYKKRSKYGVLTLIFQNKKLRDHMQNELRKLKLL